MQHRNIFISVSLKLECREMKRLVIEVGLNIKNLGKFFFYDDAI
jgi:hypothetical protein